jgi:hypothetical protein
VQDGIAAGQRPPHRVRVGDVADDVVDGIGHAQRTQRRRDPIRGPDEQPDVVPGREQGGDAV